MSFNGVYVCMWRMVQLNIKRKQVRLLRRSLSLSIVLSVNVSLFCCCCYYCFCRHQSYSQLFQQSFICVCYCKTVSQELVSYHLSSVIFQARFSFVSLSLFGLDFHSHFPSIYIRSIYHISHTHNTLTLTLTIAMKQIFFLITFFYRSQKHFFCVVCVCVLIWLFIVLWSLDQLRYWIVFSSRFQYKIVLKWQLI